MNSKQLADHILERTDGAGRYIVAIAGPPASGKSTLSEAVSGQINLIRGEPICAVVAMDGFHLDNSVLDARGLRLRKGAPETFDAEGFVRLIRRVAADDADVSVIAAHTSRMVIDLLVRPEESIFPVSAYAIGMSSQWLFEQPFDTRPIDLIPQGEWGETVEAMDADAMIEILKEHLPPKEDADATSVAE